MSKRKYESFTEEEARNVLKRCEEYHLSDDPKAQLDALVRDPKMLDDWALYQLFRDIGGWVDRRHSVDLVSAIREGLLEIPLDEPFDRECYIEKVKAVTPCCDDVTGIILQYLLPIQYAYGTVLRPKYHSRPAPNLIVHHYTRKGTCCVKIQSSDVRTYFSPINNGYTYIRPIGVGFRYMNLYYHPGNE